jgi:signal transduction histidine kinase
MTKLLCAFFIALLWSSSLSAQSYPFKFFSVEQGLSQSVVYDVEQDGIGYIWVATGFGLSRFDGQSFDSYYASDGLPSNSVHSLFTDNSSTLWIGTDNGIATYINRSISVFEGSDSLISSPVNFITSSPQDIMWFATEGDGLWRFDGRSFTNFSTKNSSLGSDSVRAIHFSESQGWLATRNGLYSFEINQNLPIEFLKIDLNLSDQRLRSVISRNNDLIVGGRSEVVVYDFVEDLVTNRFAENMRTRDILWDEKTDVLFIATETGFLRIDSENEQTVFTESNGLTNDYVQAIFKDQQEDIWLGTYGRGLALFQGEQFLGITTDDGLPGNVVSDVLGKDDETIWVGMYGGGLISLSITDFSMKRIGIIDDRVFSLEKNSNKELWVSTRGGISIIDDETREHLSPNGILPARKIRNVIELDSGRYLVGTDDEGLIEYFPETDDFNQIKVSDGLISNSVRALYKGENGWIWVGTLNGVSVLNPDDLSVLRNINVEDGIIANGVLDISEDDVGTIWLAQYGGYSSVTPSRIQAYPLNRSNEPLVCYAINWHDGLLWLGTNRGVMSVDPTQEELQYRYFTSERGLVSNEVNRGAMHFDSDDNLWVGTVTGIGRIKKPEEMPVNGSPVLIEAVSTYDEEFVKPLAVNLAYQQNSVSIHYKAFEFRDPEAVTYRYRLRPLEQQWKYTSQRSVQYSALNNEQYNFQVQAKNADGVWSEEAAVVHITIDTPFYEEAWFILLVTAIIGGILYLIYTNIRVEKMIELERMRVRIASDLHDDVGSSLTEIALQSDYVQAITDDEEARDIAGQLGEMSRRVVTTMDDIVWSIDARNDTLGDLCDRMQDYANRMTGRLPMEVHFELSEIDDDLTISVEKRQHIYLIFKEAINNAVKYAEASGVWITFRKTGKTYELKIRDDGKGFSENGRKSGHGMRNIRLRTGELGGKLRITSEKGVEIIVSGFTMN